MVDGAQNEAGAVSVLREDEFGRVLVERLGRLRDALEQVLEELGMPETAGMMARRLGVGMPVCWQVFQVARSEEVGAGVQHAPSVIALKRLLEVARQQGVTERTAARAVVAAEAFHAFVDEKAREWDALEGSGGKDGGRQFGLTRRRRVAFRANSHVWGAQNDLWLVTSMVRRSRENPACMDSVVLSRQGGLRRTRADANVYLMAMKVDLASFSEESAKDDLVRNALDPVAAGETGMPVVREFSTRPFPRVECVTTNSGRRVFNWIDESVGLGASCDVTTGTVNREVPMVVEGDGRREVVISSSVKNKASALIVVDLLVHRESFPGAEVQSLVHERISEAATLEAAQAGHQFAVEAGADFVGRGDEVGLAEFGEYGALLRSAAGRVGWRLEEFDAYRLRVPYPVMGAVHRVFFFDPVG